MKNLVLHNRSIVRTAIALRGKAMLAFRIPRGLGQSWWRVAGLAITVALSAAATDGKVQLEFSTVATGGKYSPKHVLAAWVTDAHTNFVKTIGRQAGKRQKYLTTWLKARGDDHEVDGITGATLKSHEATKVTWDGRDAKNQPLPDGTYWLFVEFTDAHRQGPIAAFPVIKGTQSQSRTFPDQEYFKKLKLTYVPTGQ